MVLYHFFQKSLFTENFFLIAAIIVYCGSIVYLSCYRLFFEIAILWDIDLQFSGLTSGVNMDNATKFREACLEVAFLKIGIFGISVCNSQSKTDMSKSFFDFVPSYGYQHLVRFNGHNFGSSWDLNPPARWH